MNSVQQIAQAISPQDKSWKRQARDRLNQLTMPHWALGRLMDLALELSGMTRSLNPPVQRRAVVVMAADHGVTAEGVSKYPQQVTAQMVANFVHRGAAINALAAVAGATVYVVNMGVAADLGELTRSGAIVSMPVGPGTANMARGPAMTPTQAVTCLEHGIRLARQLIEDQGYGLLGVGDMGIGNTTPSSAIIATLAGKGVAEVTGHGTGIDDEQLQHKVAVIERALQVNRPDPEDALDVLSKVGGFEIGGIAGIILGAASLRRPVVIDGLISTAGALLAQRLAPNAADYLIAGHHSVEKGHRIALHRLGKEPLLDLKLRLGEGSGAVLAMPLVEAAVRVLTEVKTFEEAQVAEADA